MAKKKTDESVPSPTEAQEITTWLSRIKRAEKVRDRADKKYGYTRATQMYQNDFAAAMPTFLDGLSVIPINEVFAYCKAFIPSVYARDPYITANPETARFAPGAKISELYLNAKWRDMRLKKEVKRIILDAILAEGWIKTGYSAVFGSTAPKEGEPALEASEYIVHDEIFAARVSWKLMVKDPDAVDGIHDARWVAQKIVKPLEAVKKSGVYDNTGQLQPSFVVDGTADAEAAPDKRLSGSGDDEVAYAVLWEIWDRDTDHVYTISEGCPRYLKKVEWPYDMEGFPYVLLRFNDNPDDAYAPNLIDSWIAQLWEKIKLRALQLDHIKRFNRQLSVEDGSHTKTELEKLATGRTAAVIKRKKGSGVPEPIPYPQVQADIYAVESRIDLDKDNVSGQPNAVRSAPQKTQSRTLGEIDRLISSFQARQTEPQDVVEDFCEEIAYKILKLTGQFMDGEKYVRATQRQLAEVIEALKDPITGASRFDGRGFRFTKADIQDLEVILDVRCGSTLPLNRESRIETVTGLLKLGPTIGVVPGSKVARVLGKTLLSDLELKEVEQAYDDEQAELDAQKQLQGAVQEANLKEAEVKIKNLRAGGPEAMMAAQGRGGGPQQANGGAPPRPRERREGVQ